MKRILLCSSNRLFARNLCGILRDDGNQVDEVEHPSLAVQRVIGAAYDVMVIDAEPFGLPAGDAARITSSIAPDMAVFCVGGDPRVGGAAALSLPAEPDAIRDLIRHITTRYPTDTTPEGRVA
jgi:hypothetical protein